MIKVHFVIISSSSSAFCFKHFSAVRSEAAKILYSFRGKTSLLCTDLHGDSAVVAFLTMEVVLITLAGSVLLSLPRITLQLNTYRSN